MLVCRFRLIPFVMTFEPTFDSVLVFMMRFVTDIYTSMLNESIIDINSFSVFCLLVGLDSFEFISRAMRLPTLIELIVSSIQLKYLNQLTANSLNFIGIFWTKF